MCLNFLKPKVDPNVAKLAKAQQAEIAEKKKPVPFEQELIEVLKRKKLFKLELLSKNKKIKNKQ